MVLVNVNLFVIKVREIVMYLLQTTILIDQS